MRPRDILGVFIRFFGLLICAYGLYDELYAIMEAAGFILQAQYSAARHGMFGVLFFLIGAVIVRTADLVAKLAYWSDRKTGE